MRNLRFSLLLSFLSFYSTFCLNSNTTSPLSGYDISDITVSGISAGGFMAVQMPIAFSSIISGAAAFAAGPYMCAENNVVSAEYKCMKIIDGPPDLGLLIQWTKDYEFYGTIDHTKNLKDDKVYLFSGKADSVVNQAVVKSLESYYNYWMPNQNIVADFSIQAEHCFPTLNYGENCETLSLPYIGKCHFDGAGAALKALYNVQKSTSMINSNLMAFDQQPYWPDKVSSLAEQGYIYVPTACQNHANKCSLHISFHGCEQTEELIGNDYASKIGMNEWAEANKIIVLYPYVKVSPSGVPPMNPNGCWDWWGYTDVYYATKLGKQMQFVRSLIKAIAGY